MLDPAKAFAALDSVAANVLYYNYDFGDDWEPSIEARDVRLAPLAEAEWLMSWARNAVGWRPFASAADLVETFD